MALAPTNPLASDVNAQNRQAAGDRARLSTLNRARRAYMRGDIRAGQAIERSLKLQDEMAAMGAPVGATRRAEDITSIAGGRLAAQDALIAEQQRNAAMMRQMRENFFRPQPTTGTTAAFSAGGAGAGAGAAAATGRFVATPGGGQKWVTDAVDRPQPTTGPSSTTALDRPQPTTGPAATPVSTTPAAAATGRLVYGAGGSMKWVTDQPKTPTAPPTTPAAPPTTPAAPPTTPAAPTAQQIKDNQAREAFYNDPSGGFFRSPDFSTPTPAVAAPSAQTLNQPPIDAGTTSPLTGKPVGAEGLGAPLSSPPTPTASPSSSAPPTPTASTPSQPSAMGTPRLNAAQAQAAKNPEGLSARFNPPGSQAPISALDRGPFTLAAEGIQAVGAGLQSQAARNPEGISAKLTNLFGLSKPAPAAASAPQEAAPSTPKNYSSVGINSDVWDAMKAQNPDLTNPAATSREGAALATSLDNLEASLRKPPAPRAMGGPVKAGSPYLVGEEGPEIVVPAKDGTVIPAKQTQELLKKKRREMLMPKSTAKARG